jgi:hypothetical protein
MFASEFSAGSIAHSTALMADSAGLMASRPSRVSQSRRLFLSIVAVHVALGLVGVVAGALAMLS